MKWPVVFFRAFNGTRVHVENIANSEPDTQPHAWAAQQWFLPFLDEVFDWTNLSKVLVGRCA